MKKSKALLWTDKLRARDIKVFEFNMLPEDLRDRSYFRQAISQGEVIRIRKSGRYKSIWKLKDDNQVKRGPVV